MGEDGVAPETAVIGTGDPRVAIVAGIHGDEPSGVRAIERLKRRVANGELVPEVAVLLVVANPSAVEAGTRFVETDLNRAFPGDEDGLLEERLAPQVLDAIGDRPTLSLHATKSHHEPFAFVDPDRQELYEIATSLPIRFLIRPGDERIGALGEWANVISVEAGRQGTDAAADSAEDLVVAFLQLTGILPGRPRTVAASEFVVGDAIPKPPAETYAVHVRNFERVEAGQVYASADGTDFVAEEAFYPILLSADGYDEIFGFKGTLIGVQDDG